MKDVRGIPGVFILAGPTATGKTDLAIELAERFDAEIVGADSRQIYRDMEVGTAAPSALQRARVPHHLIGFLDPRERYSAARYSEDALTAIRSIHARGKRAIVVGGTGFYVRALCGDVALNAAYDPLLRARLARETRLHPPAFLHEWLALHDPERASSVAVTDSYRIVRALEIALAHGIAGGGENEPQPSLRSTGIPFLKTGLEIEASVLEGRIVARVDAMLADGFVEEAERVGAHAVAADAVGYPYALAYLEGKLGDAELRALLVRATRRYAKRQRTWFRSEPSLRPISYDEARTALALTARELPGWA